jgi:hypothetical protein
MSEFKKGLSNKFIDQLAEEANKGSWWADVLNDPQLFIAVRNQYLNVYWRGQSLFKVVSQQSGLKATMHPKFLIDPGVHDEVTLINRKFNVDKLVEGGIIREYKGPETLEKMKRAAGLFYGPEDSGCHDIILHNPHLIDREIGFSDTVTASGGEPNKETNLIDLLTLESDGDVVRLVFWEAKHFSNAELRPVGPIIPVCEQIKRYRNCISRHRNEIEVCYRRVAENLAAMQKLGWKRELSPLVKDVAEGRALTLGRKDEEPKVGLVIFDFTSLERDTDIWQAHLAGLKSEIKHVMARGNPKAIKLDLCACD